MTQAVWQTDLAGLPAPRRGKVRDMYDLGDALLMVATDRLSAFDVVMPDPVPDKGKVLTQISLYWFRTMARLVGNHVITANAEEFPPECLPHADVLRGRSILVKKLRPLPVECVVRGYITGSGWKSYKAEGAVCGIPLPKGLAESDRLPEPLFTPTTKAETGAHDENITFQEVEGLLGAETAAKVRNLSIAIYSEGARLALSRGILIADTKFEFGQDADGGIVLIDEVLTPDSSRFWPLDTYAPGRSQDSYDKQYVRDYLEAIKWEKKPPAPKLPEEVIVKTREKYVQALERLAGVTL
jgi:phosphoribosylaminoimidazole-succinocarboxamide synthase